MKHCWCFRRLRSLLGPVAETTRYPRLWRLRASLSPHNLIVVIICTQTAIPRPWHQSRTHWLERHVVCRKDQVSQSVAPARHGSGASRQCVFRVADTHLRTFGLTIPGFPRRSPTGTRPPEPRPVSSRKRLVMSGRAGTFSRVAWSSRWTVCVGQSKRATPPTKRRWCASRADG
jgi:hypothetical protein